jgi:phage baseplate assembly protein W
MPTTTSPQPLTPTPAFPGYGQTTDLGSNWRIKFYDADGLPLSMVSFEVIDFGAIAYKEIFQNAKTILATPIWSAALERLLGVDQSIVDLPIGQAAEATIAILDALYFWEPRVEVVNIQFASDVISGHLVCDLQLKVRNVIFGTDTPYDKNNVFEIPTPVEQALPPMNLPPTLTPIPGPPGPAGPRGSIWFMDIVDPAASTKISHPQAMDVFLNTTTGDVFQLSDDGAGSLAWRKLS